MLTYRIGEKPCFALAPNQPGITLRTGEFAHVEPFETVDLTENKFRESSRQFGFANSGWTNKKQNRKWQVKDAVLQQRIAMWQKYRG